MNTKSTTILSLLALIVSLLTLFYVISIKNELAKFEADAAVEYIEDYPPTGVDAENTDVKLQVR